jgi:hypothetical protein
VVQLALLEALSIKKCVFVFKPLSCRYYGKFCNLMSFSELFIMVNFDCFEYFSSAFQSIITDKFIWNQSVTEIKEIIRILNQAL